MFWDTITLFQPRTMRVYQFLRNQSTFISFHADKKRKFETLCFEGQYMFTLLSDLYGFKTDDDWTHIKFTNQVMFNTSHKSSNNNCHLTLNLTVKFSGKKYNARMVIGIHGKRNRRDCSSSASSQAESCPIFNAHCTLCNFCPSKYCFQCSWVQSSKKCHRIPKVATMIL